MSPMTLITDRTMRSRLGPLAFAAALVLAASGCGGDAGTTSYTDPVGTTKTASAIIDAATLRQWADEGKINAPFGIADRVVVVSVTTRANFTSTTRKHIPDAVLLDNSTDLTTTREEGLGPATVMMATGPMMDSLVKKLGIDGATTIVFTFPKGSTDSEHLQQAVAFWTFRYWGFARDRVKLLNGGDDAWEAAGGALTDAVVSVTPSTYSVASNKVLKPDLRHSVGEMLTLIDSMNRDRNQLNAWQMLDVRGYTTSPYLANGLRGNGPMQYITDRVNGESTRNRLYPDAATLTSRMATIPVVDGTANAFLSPNKKTVVMCGSSTNCAPTWVLFDAVLAVPEGSISSYDGSSGQWNNYSFAKIKAAGATDAQANTWAFDAVTSGTSLTRAIGTLPAAVAGENAFIPGNFAYLPTQLEVNQIERDDAKYMTTSSGGTTPGTPGGSPGGGC
jgi:3-mercaptopyruvate sulfurtransferase SseA